MMFEHKIKNRNINVVGNILGHNNNGGASRMMQQKWNCLSIIEKNILRKQFRDSDRDGVPNKFDCRPYNRRRQDDEPTTDVMIIPSNDDVETPNTFVENLAQGAGTIVGNTGRFIMASPKYLKEGIVTTAKNTGRFINTSEADLRKEKAENRRLAIETMNTRLAEYKLEQSYLNKQKQIDRYKNNRSVNRSNKRINRTVAAQQQNYQLRNNIGGAYNAQQQFRQPNTYITQQADRTEHVRNIIGGSSSNNSTYNKTNRSNNRYNKVDDKLEHVRNILR